MSLWLPPLLGYQENTVGRVGEIRSSGTGRSILCVAPPGAGKSRTMMELAEREYQKGDRSLIKVHRRMLLEQMVTGFTQAGYEIGVIAPGYKEGEPIPGIDKEVINDLDAPILIGSTQTLFARTVRRSRMEFPDVRLVVNDEAHQQTGKQERGLAYGAFTEDGFIQEGYLAKGATLVGFTATPLMNQRIYTDLIQMVNYSELRKQGMHLPIQLFGPDEIDTAGLKVNSEGEYKETDLEPRVQAIFGSVYDEYMRLNPNKLPSILFAPSVACSKWFCYQLSAKGIPSAHIGSDCILMSDASGVVTPYAATPENRRLILEKSKSGEIKILCNRFVLREAIDMPWLYHAIFATVMGSTTTYLQSVGRLQRSFAGYSVKVLQDHGGCLDSKTEVLTPSGWKGMSQMSAGDSVYGFIPETGEIRSVKAISTYSRTVQHNENTGSVESKRLDIRVTTNHRIVYKCRTTKGRDNYQWPSEFVVEKLHNGVSDLARIKIPLCGIEQGQSCGLTDHEISFIGWWLTDGTASRTDRSISQKETYVSNCDHIRETLAGCGFHWKENRSLIKKYGYHMIKFSVPKGTCKSKPRSGWHRLESYLDKNFPESLLNISKREFDVLLNAIHLGDGTKGLRDGRYRISTGNLTFADRLQSLAVRRGYSAIISKPNPATKTVLINISDLTEAVIQGESKGSVGQASWSIASCGHGEKVWCVENEIGTLITRRNGKVAILGNCYWRHGSPNSDRYWQLGNTNSSCAKERIEKIVKGEIPEGIRCPKCSMWRTGGPVCPNETCRHASSQSVRVVRQVNGKLKHIKGSVFYSENMVDRAKKLWKQWLWRGGKSGMTVGGVVAACGDAARKQGIQIDFNAVPWKPPAADSMEWHRLARDHWPWLKGNKKKAESNEKATEQAVQTPEVVSS